MSRTKNMRLIKLKSIAFITLLIFFISWVHITTKPAANQKMINVQIDTCDNPDAKINCCFLNMPSKLTNVMTIAGQNEAGGRLIITGTLFKPDGVTPYPNVILYAYHTDNSGHYSKKGDEKGVQKWHGHLHGWCKSGSDGKYELHTIRPARYPDNSVPAHIHAAFKLPGGQMGYINDFVFKDDSLVNEKYLSSLSDIGGTGVVDIKKTAKNIWKGKRDLILK